MKSKHLILFLFLIPALLSAKTLTRNELKTLGTRAFQQKAQHICPEAASYALKNCDFLNESNELCMAVLHFEHGFLIMSAEDRVMPVLAYDFTNDIDLNDLAPAIDLFLTQYRNEIMAARRQQTVPDARIQRAWDELLHPSRATLDEMVVTPLITSSWNQNKYYNYYSPRDNDAPGGYDGKVPNGCVAVAMAQIIYYYRYPESGHSSHTNHNSNYGNFYVNFAQQHYNYDAMADALAHYNNEVAKLIFHCGTAVDMGYGADGSGAYSHDVPNAMSTYFKYNLDSEYTNKHNYSDSTWHLMLKSDLDELRPVYYSGYSEEGGHAFVCDGYNSDDYFHFNFGWGGSGNGYFITESGNSSAVGGYSGWQSCIFNLHPRTNSYPTYCNDRIITATTGTLEDGSGNQDYLNNTSCTYVISQPQQYAVNISLKYLASQEDHDYLRFWDGHPSQNILLEELSGNISNTSYSFNTDSLYITFETDDSITDQGWHLSFSSSKEGFGCGTHITHDPEGEIYDNSDTNNYRDNMSCNWAIRIKNVPSITFTFEEFDISPEDHLDFYNMSVYPYELMESYTGNNNPGVVTFYTNRIQVTFVSDNYLNAQGFRVLWSSSQAGIEDFCSEASLYPNPASDMLHLTLPEDIDQCGITIYSMSGQAVFTQHYVGVETLEIPVRQLPNGIYTLRAESNGRTMHRKIVVMH